MSRVQALGCVLCKVLGTPGTPAEVHHIDAAFVGGRSDFLVPPLCTEHHRGKTGYHGLGGRKPFEDLYQESELSLLALVIRDLSR